MHSSFTFDPLLFFFHLLPFPFSFIHSLLPFIFFLILTPFLFIFLSLLRSILSPCLPVCNYPRCPVFSPRSVHGRSKEKIVFENRHAGRGVLLCPQVTLTEVSRCVPRSCWQRCLAVSPGNADRGVLLCRQVTLTEVSRCVPRSYWQRCLAVSPGHADRGVSLCPQVMLTEVSRCVPRTTGRYRQTTSS